MTTQFLAELALNHYADISEVLKNETNQARRIFLEAELERHADNYLYWSTRDINLLMEAGFEAVVDNEQGEITYRM